MPTAIWVVIAVVVAAALVAAVYLARSRARTQQLRRRFGRTMDHYRSAHAITGRAAKGEASTEDLRQAMVHYRALFEELLSVPAGERPGGGTGRPGGEPDHGERGTAGDPGPAAPAATARHRDDRPPRS